MYQRPYTQQHIPRRDGQELRGTVRYASINVHLGIEPSRRDDLESLSYILIYFLRGSLPWQGIKANKHRRYDAILKMKQASSGLCEGLPREFQTFLAYTRRLQFDEEPNYAYLRRILRSLAARNGYIYDQVFDWTERVDREEYLEPESSPSVLERTEDDSDISDYGLPSHIHDRDTSLSPALFTHVEE